MASTDGSRRFTLLSFMFSSGTVGGLLLVAGKTIGWFALSSQHIPTYSEVPLDDVICARKQRPLIPQQCNCQPQLMSRSGRKVQILNWDSLTAAIVLSFVLTCILVVVISASYTNTWSPVISCPCRKNSETPILDPLRDC